VVGVVVGTYLPSCASNDQCSKGTFCTVGFRGLSRCDFCGHVSPLRMQDDLANGTLNLRPMVNDYSGFNKTLVAEVCRDTMLYDGTMILWDDADNRGLTVRSAVTSWCEGCVSPIDMAVDPLNMNSLMAANVAAMGRMDWLALIFAAVVIALTVNGEHTDIELVALTVRHAGDRLSPRWRLALTLLGGVRRWTFLPMVASAAPVLVVLKGGDALSVCLNTVGVLFLCEIDDITYSMLLSERVRSRAEERGRLVLGDTEALALERSKAAHAATLTVAMPLAVWVPAWMARTGANLFIWKPAQMAMGLAFGAFWLAGAVGAISDARSSGGGVAGACTGVAKVTGAFCLGWILMIVLILASMNWNPILI